MTNIIEERGQFWWFGEEEGQASSIEHSVHGLLRITEEGQITLQLEGPLWLEEPDTVGWLGPEKRIIGRLGIFGDAGCVLLHELVRTDFSFPGEPDRQRYEADFCFKHDFAFPSNFDLRTFNALRVELSGLEDWLGLQAIDVGPEKYRGNQVEFTVRYDKVQIDYDTSRAKVSIENLVLGALPPVSLSPQLVASANIEQTNWLVYEPKEQLNLTQFQTCFRRVEEVISLLIGQYCRLDWPTLVAKFEEFDAWFTLYWKRGARPAPVPPVTSMMTMFPSIREDFGNMLDHWELGATKYGAGYELYIASLRQPLPYPEHQFVNLAWAIESLHRAWQRDTGETAEVEKNKGRITEVLSRFEAEGDNKLHRWLAGKVKYAYEPTLESRIVESFQRLPFAFDPLTLKTFAKRCARLRNNISHEGGRQPGEDSAAFISELRKLAKALGYLFHALLLHEIGLSKDLLLTALTRGSMLSMTIVPALREVGIELPMPPERPAADIPRRVGGSIR